MSVPPDPLVDAHGVEGVLSAVMKLDTMSDAMDQTVTQATSAVDGLKELLLRLDALAVLAREHQRNEEKIGQLFIKVQDYINRATSDAEEQAKSLIAEAEFEASQIVAAAKEEAHRLVSEARRPIGIPPAAIAQLQSTIEGFARLNSDLLHELAALNQALVFNAQLQTAPPPPSAPLPPPPQPTADSGDSRTPAPRRVV